MHMVRPTNDRDKRIFLENVTRNARTHKIPGAKPLPGYLIQASESLLDEFGAILDRVQIAFAQRKEAVAERALVQESFVYAVRDVWSSVKRRARRRGDVAHSEAFFQNNRDITNIKRQDEWLVAAEELLVGEREVTGRGAPAMANPSASELSALLEETKAAAGRVDAAKANLEDFRKTLQAKREEVIHFHQDLARYLRFAMGRRPAESQREQMRRFGFIFKSPGGKQPTVEAPQEATSEPIINGDPQKNAAAVKEEQTQNTGVHTPSPHQEPLDPASDQPVRQARQRSRRHPYPSNPESTKPMEQSS